MRSSESKRLQSSKSERSATLKLDAAVHSASAAAVLRSGAFKVDARDQTSDPCMARHECLKSQLSFRMIDGFVAGESRRHCGGSQEGLDLE